MVPQMILKQAGEGGAMSLLQPGIHFCHNLRRWKRILHGSGPTTMLL